MNPYVHGLGVGPIDIETTWFFALVGSGIATLVFYFRDLAKYGEHRAENRSLCWPVIQAFLLVCGICAAISATALILLLLHVVGIFWFFYEVPWVLSEVCTFYFLSVILIPLIVWAFFNKHRVGMEGRMPQIVSVCVAGVALNVALYFVSALVL
jgi:hypothetical protein